MICILLIRGSCLPRFALLPFQTRPYSRKILAWLDAADLDALVMHNAPCGTFSYFSSKYFNAASCTLELGKRGHLAVTTYRSLLPLITLCGP